VLTTRVASYSKLYNFGKMIFLILITGGYARLQRIGEKYIQLSNNLRVILIC